MHTPGPLLTRRSASQIFLNSTWAYALIWLLVTVAALLLVGFTAVVQDTTQRGELRQMHERVSGSLLLPDELPARAVEGHRLRFIYGEKIADR